MLRSIEQKKKKNINTSSNKSSILVMRNSICLIYSNLYSSIANYITGINFVRPFILIQEAKVTPLLCMPWTGNVNRY